jgi:hypothetical protein
MAAAWRRCSGFETGARVDRVVDEDGVLRFAELLCIYDSTIIPISLVYPI